MPDRGKGWFPDERAHAGRENLDSEHVSLYDRKESWDAVADLDALGERRDAAWKLGCGA